MQDAWRLLLTLSAHPRATLPSSVGLLLAPLPPIVCFTQSGLNISKATGLPQLPGGHLTGWSRRPAGNTAPALAWFWVPMSSRLCFGASRSKTRETESCRHTLCACHRPEYSRPLVYACLEENLVTFVFSGDLPLPRPRLSEADPTTSDA